MSSPSAASFIRPDELWREVGLRAHQTIVHLGCGAGFYLIPAAKIVGAKGKAIGVDILPDMLAETEGKAAREGVAKVVHTIRSNLEGRQGSTVPEASADWVLIANILHQANPAQILAEAKRILRPGGQVVVIEWDGGASPFGPSEAERLPRQAALEAAESARFSLVRSFQPSPYHYGLILR